VTIVVLIVVALVIVIVGGLLVYKLMNKAQTVVPDAADPRPTGDRVVGTDDQGNAILDRDEPAEPPQDDGAFESLLQDELYDRGMQPPRADDEA
jgi:hypothetical protein